GRRFDARRAPPRGGARRRLAAAGHGPRQAAGADRVPEGAPREGARRRPDRDRRQQRVALRRQAGLRPRAERTERRRRGDRGVPPRARRARRPARRRPLPDAVRGGARRPDRNVRGRGGAAPLMLLAGRVVIVSGVGPGLGQAVALACAREGADLVLAARSTRALEEVAEHVRGLGRRALPVTTDIARAGDCTRLAALTREHFGRADVLVNNAFRSAPYDTFEDAKLDDWRQIFEVNVFGSLALTQ